MNASVEDLRPTIIPKSDQLNAEQLLGGPMTVTVTEDGKVSKGGEGRTFYEAGAKILVTPAQAKSLKAAGYAK